MTGYQLAPITVKAALRHVEETHRHLPELQGALFAAAVKRQDAIVGVAVAANPARVWQGTGRFVIARCAAQSDLPSCGVHAAPVCTMLYSALCRAGKALGYTEAWTYSLPGEDGRSIRAAGFLFMGYSNGARGHESRPGRRTINAGPKGRWARGLTPIAHALLLRAANKVKASPPERMAA